MDFEAVVIRRWQQICVLSFHTYTFTLHNKVILQIISDAILVRNEVLYLLLKKNGS
jgi:hypothetical protein